MKTFLVVRKLNNENIVSEFMDATDALEFLVDSTHTQQYDTIYLAEKETGCHSNTLFSYQSLDTRLKRC